MHERFETPIPPHDEVFSFRKTPCKYESAGVSGGPQGPCPYIEDCLATATDLAYRLNDCYGLSMQTTLSEASSSIVIRSEYQFIRALSGSTRQQSRHALRKHIFATSPVVQSAKEQGLVPCSGRELRMIRDRFLDRSDERLAEFKRQLTFTKDRYAPARKLIRALQTIGVSKDKCRDFIGRLVNPFWCSRFPHSQKFTKYLGFVDLRCASPRSDDQSQRILPIAFGVLRPPRRYRHCANTYLITGEYGSLFGGVSFVSSVYSMFDPSTSGATCTQSCVLMSLAMMSDRGARVRGSFTATFIGMHGKRREVETIDPECSLIKGINAELGIRPNKSIRAGGLEPDEAHQALSKSGVRPSIIYFTEFDLNGPQRATAAQMNASNASLLRVVLEAYIYARLPIIMFVDTAIWWNSPEFKEKHAVIIIGVRRLDRGNGLNAYALIHHDPGDKPYLERPLDECVEACLAYHNCGDDEQQDVHKKWLGAKGDLDPGSRFSRCGKMIAVGDQSIQLHPWADYRDYIREVRSYMEGHQGADEILDLAHRVDIEKLVSIHARMRVARMESMLDLLPETEAKTPQGFAKYIRQNLDKSKFWAYTIFTLADESETEVGALRPWLTLLMDARRIDVTLLDWTPLRKTPAELPKFYRLANRDQLGERLQEIGGGN